MKLLNEEKFLEEIEKRFVNTNEILRPAQVVSILSKHLHNKENIVGVKIGRRKKVMRICAACNQAISDCEEK